MRGGSRLSLLSFQTIFILIIMLSFYILFLIPSFLIYPHKLFSMQLEPGTVSLACARLIVPFSPFNANTRLEAGLQEEIIPNILHTVSWL